MLADGLLWLYLRVVKGGEGVLAMLYASRIISGKSVFAGVPALLKEQVAEILRDQGLEQLVDGATEEA